MHPTKLPSVLYARTTTSKFASGSIAKIFLNPDCSTRIAEVLQAVGTDASRSHLILDVFAIDQAQISLLLAILPGIISGLPYLDQWLSFTLLSGAFPVNLSEVAPGVGTFARNDWILWQQLASIQRGRMPSFGDYGIAHPAPQEEVDPRFMHVSASIRYTASHQWLIFRGRDVRHPAHGGFTQFRNLSAQVVAHPAYTGATLAGATPTSVPVRPEPRRLGTTLLGDELARTIT